MTYWVKGQLRDMILRNHMKLKKTFPKTGDYGYKENPPEQSELTREYVGEDERLVIQNDPEYKKALEFNVENISSENDLGSFQFEDSSFEFSSEDAKADLEDKLFIERYAKEIGIDLTPFDEQDILGKRTADFKNRKEQEEKAKKLKDREIEMEKKRAIRFGYSVPDFKKMEESFLFEEVLKNKKLQDIESSRPTFANGDPMKDEQINEVIQEYEVAKAEARATNNWGKFNDTFNKTEQVLMKKCSVFQYLKKVAGVEPTRYADGSGIPVEQRKKLATEYAELKEKNPIKFAKMKVESKEWHLKKFNWEKEVYNGRESIVSWNKGKRGIVEKYELVNTPKDMNMGDMANFFIVQNFIPITTKKGTKMNIFRVLLRPPYSVPKEELKDIEVE